MLETICMPLIQLQTLLYHSSSKILKNLLLALLIIVKRYTNLQHQIFLQQPAQIILIPIVIRVHIIFSNPCTVHVDSATRMWTTTFISLVKSLTNPNATVVHSVTCSKFVAMVWGQRKICFSMSMPCAQCTVYKAMIYWAWCARTLLAYTKPRRKRLGDESEGRL